MKTMVLFAALLLIVTPAFADSDGVTKVSGHTIPGVVVDVAPGSIDRDELSTDVQADLDATKTTVEQHGTQLGEHSETLTLHTTALAQHSEELADQGARIGSLESLTASQGVQLNAHDALLSQHSQRLDEQARGLAIAMAMPDAWLSDKKTFGIFGAVGGFNDETALGFAAIGRLDETFTLNAKIGTDTGFKDFGWQIGAGAQF